MSCAQSKGEYPGSRTTFLGGRKDGGSVDVDAARPASVSPGRRDGGPRRAAAEEGGGLREPFSFGKGRRAEGLTGGGGISVVAEGLAAGCRLYLRGSVGGGMDGESFAMPS